MRNRLGIRIGNLNKRIDTLYLCFLMAFFRILIFNGLGSVFAKIGIHGNLHHTVYYIIYTIFFCYSLKKHKITKSILTKWYAYYIAIMILWIYAKMVSPAAFQMDMTGLTVGIYFLFFPSFIFVIFLINDFTEALKYLVWSARILAIWCVLSAFSAYSALGGMVTTSDYNMGLGYNCALCGVVLLFSLFFYRNFYDIGCSVVLFFVTLSLGSRGAALIFLLSFLVMYITKMYQRGISKKTVFYIILLTTISLLVIANFYTIMENILRIFENYHINSRTMTLLLNGRINVSTGRNTVHEAIYEAWKSMPVLGYGILGDRMFTQGYYSHNIFLEIITDFGFVLGAAFIVWFIYGIIRCLKFEPYRKITLMCSVYCLTYLFFSSSYLIQPTFYVLLGVILKRKRIVWKECN